MKGQKIKEILQGNGYSLKDVAEAMGETPQNFQAMLKVEDIKTGVLERIANAINKNIIFFLSESNEDNNELKVINEIMENQRLILDLYQRIVDVEMLIEENLKIKSNHDFIGDAALITNSITWDKLHFRKKEGDNVKFTSWKEYNLLEKKIYCLETKEAARNLKELFFSRFRVLYKNMRGIKD